MPVKFHPNNSVPDLEKIILKKDGTPLFGEIDIYRTIDRDLGKSEDDWDVWHDLSLPIHSDKSNPYKKTSAQIDFLIIGKKGIIVLEVKGGPISVKDNSFYYGKEYNDQMKQNPFSQVEGYKFTLMEHYLNHQKKVFFRDVVAFPHVDYPFESKLIDSSRLWTKHTSSIYEDDFEVFLKNTLSKAKRDHSKYDRVYRDISTSERQSINRVLSPMISDGSPLNTINTLEWLSVQNIEILEGLIKNSRIMIQGPPGSGKTTLAKAFMDKQFNKRGLYICWNSFLMCYTKSILDKREMSSRITVTTFFNFFHELNPEIDRDIIFQFSEDEFYELVKLTIHKLKEQKTITKYDFIVVDEAQDLFDRGLDVFLNEFTGSGGRGLSNGNSLILYDIDQSYSYQGRNVEEISNLLAEYFARFEMSEVKRSSQNPEIRDIAQRVLDDPTVLVSDDIKQNLTKIDVNIFDDLKSAKSHLLKNVLRHIRDSNSSLLGKDCILLVESSLFKKNSEESLDEMLIVRDIEELTKTNINDSLNKLRYTSILKYKGLEKKNVYMLISEPNGYNAYEIYVGITRAILNLEINIVKDL